MGQGGAHQASLLTSTSQSGGPFIGARIPKVTSHTTGPLRTQMPSGKPEQASGGEISDVQISTLGRGLSRRSDSQGVERISELVL